MVCSLSCALLVSIGDRDFAPADGYWSAQISHRIRFNRGCLRGQDICRLRNHDIGRGRIQKGRLSIVCREKLSLFLPRSCARHRLTVAGEWRYSHLRRKGSARQAQAAPALLLPQWRPRSWLRWSPSSGWTVLASLAPFVASASSPGTRNQTATLAKQPCTLRSSESVIWRERGRAGHANGICGTLGRDDHMVSHTLANPNAAGSIASQHRRRSSQSALFYATR
jgi:hypothetical protein